MSNIVSLKAVRDVKEAETEEHAYRAMILTMDKVDLLEEMVRFQEERSRIGELSLSIKALEETAETQELKILTRSYRRHLDYELEDFRKKQLS
jgi:hypothetical protein